MSDPAKDAQIQRDKSKRESTYEDYEPIVLWVKSGRFMVDETSKGVYPTCKVIKGIIKDNVDFDEFIDIADDEPDIKDIITEFDDYTTI